MGSEWQPPSPSNDDATTGPRSGPQSAVLLAVDERDNEAGDVWVAADIAHLDLEHVPAVRIAARVEAALERAANHPGWPVFLSRSVRSIRLGCWECNTTRSKVRRPKRDARSNRRESAAARVRIGSPSVSRFRGRTATRPYRPGSRGCGATAAGAARRATHMRHGSARGVWLVSRGRPRTRFRYRSRCRG